MLRMLRNIFTACIDFRDKLLYMTSLNPHHALSSVRDPELVALISDAIAHYHSRYSGLQLLEIAITQDSDYVFDKGNWLEIIKIILKDSHASTIEKYQACKLLTLLAPEMHNNDSFVNKHTDTLKEIVNLLVTRAYEDIELTDEACICLKTLMQTFPLIFQSSQSQHDLHNLILSKVSSSNGSKSFEALAECFAELPNLSRTSDEFETSWKNQYRKTFATIESLLIECLTNLCKEPPRIDDCRDLEVYPLKSTDNNFATRFIQNVRCFINLCKCLSKMLSTKTRYAIEVPSLNIMRCFNVLYRIKNENLILTAEVGVFSPLLVQMQLASLSVMESLILNCNLLSYAEEINGMFASLISYSESSISSVLISELRAAVWRLMSIWLDNFRQGVCISQTRVFLNQILQDIDVDPKESHEEAQRNISAVQAVQEETKPTYSRIHKKSRQQLCEAALTCLESFLHIGLLECPEESLEGITIKLFKICDAIRFSLSPSFPVPYDDESCREKLYSNVVSMLLLLKPNGYKKLQSALEILNHVKRDPSFKVRKLSNKMTVIYRLQLYQKRPLPVYLEKKKQTHNEMQNRTHNVHNDCATWSGPSVNYETNIPVESPPEAHESMHDEQSFQNENEVEIHSDSYMEIENHHYQEQIIETSIINGEEMIASQCTDDMESDDDDEEEEEDEEINQEEHLQEMYIPNSRETKDSPPSVYTKSDVNNVVEPEYEELESSAEEHFLNNSNNSDKGVSINGENCDEIPCEDIPSSSANQITNENGSFRVEEEDGGVDGVDEDEEEEERPAKKLRTEPRVEPEVQNERVENPQGPEADSPSLEEMEGQFLTMMPSPPIRRNVIHSKFVA